MRIITIALPLLTALTVAIAHPGDGLDIDSKGNIYFTDVNTRTLWKLDNEQNLSAVVKDRWAHGLCVDGLDRVWIEVEVNNTQYSVWRIDPDGSETNVLAPIERGLDFYGVNIAADSEGNLYFPHSDPPHFWTAGVRKRSPDGRSVLIAGANESGHRDGRGNQARFQGVQSMRFGPDGRLFLVDVEAVRAVSLEGEVATLHEHLRDKNPEDQPFDNGNPNVSNRIYGLDVDAKGNVYLAYHGNRRVLKLHPNGTREVIYRSEKPWSPVGVCLMKDDLIIKESGLEPGSDSPGPRIRKLKPNGSIETLVVIGNH